MEDERFKSIIQDPRFKRMPKTERKVKIDRRFEGMFKDKKFKLKYSVDKRGRPLNATTDDNLRRFYEISGSESDSNDDDEEEKNKSKKVKSEKTKKDVKKSKSGKNSKSVSSKELVSKSATIESGSKSNMAKKQKKISNGGKTERQEPKSKTKSQPSLQKKNLQEKSDSEDDDDSDGSFQDDSEDEEGMNTSSSSASSSDDSDLQDDDDDLPQVPGPDLIRGEGNIETSSSDSSSSDEDDDEEEEDDSKDEVEHGWGELDKDAPRDDTVTSRLAVCNMDWDRLKAQDILVMLNSFKPTGGIIKCVTIYPSEYGKERMAEEDVKGPLEMLDHDAKNNDKPVSEEGNEYHRERLRKYQLQRLKYYYAVIECDSKTTANTLYEQCDRLEYQSSSTVLDLRFIPDDMTFNDEPKDQATELPDAALYKPAEFRTTALHQSKVELTWDETDHIREKKTLEVFGKKDLDEADVQAYLASSSGEEDNTTAPAFEIDDDFEDAEDDNDDNDEDQISKYRSLLQGIDEKEKEEKEEQDMEISWEPGLKDTAEELVKKKMETGAQLTPWETYMEKKREKKRKKQEDKNKVTKTVDPAEQQEGDQAAFSDDDLPPGMDLQDSFFKDSLKEQNGAVKGAGKKKKKKNQEPLTETEMEEQKQKKAELELLMMDEDDDKEHFNLKEIMDKEKQNKRKKRKRKQQEITTKQEDNFEINVKDPRFDAIYTSHLYSIDPSASEYKKTKSMNALINEKQKRRVKTDWTERTKEKGQSNKGQKDRVVEEKKTSGVKKDTELSMLVKSIKNKTQQFNAKKTKKINR